MAQTSLSEFLCLMVTDKDRDAITAWIYGRKQLFLPGGGVFKQGLFSWEREALRSGFFPPRGRIVVGGVGGGRELVGLLGEGYEVVAFEPSDLVEGARQAAAGLDHAEVIRASYRDVISAAQAGVGPLKSIFDQPVDGVVLGWSSLSHLVSEEERRGLLAALRLLAPTAPILLSFYMLSDFRYNRNKVRASLGRRVLRRHVEPGLSFLPGIGFTHLFRQGEIEALARDARYSVAYYDPTQEPHAILVPATGVNLQDRADRSDALDQMTTDRSP